jgi:hypothetical protein
MKESTLSLMACAVLCLAGCDEWNGRKDRNDQTSRNDAEASPSSAEIAADAERRDITERGDRGTSPPAVAADPGTPRHEAAGKAVPPTDSGVGERPDAPRTKREFVEAARRRLDQLQGELVQLEARSKERGKQLRGEIRAEKQRLDTELDQLDQQSEEAWIDTKQGFADALEKLEGKIRQVREDVDPDA